MGWPGSDLHAIVLGGLQQLSGGELCSDCMNDALSDCCVPSWPAVQQLLQFAMHADRKCTQQRHVQPETCTGSEANSVELWQVGKLL